MRRFLSLALATVLASPAHAGADVWPALEAWMREGLKLQSQEPKTEALRTGTAAILRRDPALALEPALARSFVDAHALELNRIEPLTDLLTRGVLPPITGAGAVYDAALFDGRLVIAGKEGIHEEDGGSMRRVLEAGTYRIIEADGKRLAATDHGLFVHSDGLWLRQNTAKGSATTVAHIDGVLYAGSPEGLLVNADQERPSIDPELGARWVSAIAKLCGRLYAATEYGLFRKDGEWRRIFPVATDARAPLLLPYPISDVASIDGLLHIGTNDGIVSEKSAGRFRLVRSPGQNTTVYSIVAAGDGHYASVGGRVFAWRRGLWSQALDETAQAYRVLELEGKIFVASARGLIPWYPNQNGLPADWRERALADVGAEIGRGAKTPAEAPADLLRRKDGRSLLSDLMGRVGLALGGPRPGFAAPSDVWTDLEKSLLDDLDAAGRPSRAAAWRQETARRLRGEPGLSLEEALNGAFASVHSLRKDARRPRLLLAPDAFKDGHEKLENLFTLEGVAYAVTGKDGSTDGSVYRLEKGPPWRAVALPRVEKLADLNDRNFAVASDGLWAARRIRRQGPTLRWLGLPRQAFQFRDALYLLTSRGLFRRNESGYWTSVFDGGERGAAWSGDDRSPRIDDVFLLDGWLTVKTNKGMYRLIHPKKKRWHKLAAGHTPPSGSDTVSDGIAVGDRLSVFDGQRWQPRILDGLEGRRCLKGFTAGGRVYLISFGTHKDSELFRVDGNHATLLSRLDVSGVPPITHILEVDDRVYIVGNGGLWRLPLGFIERAAPGWQDRTLEDIKTAVAEQQGAPMENARNPSSTVRRDGRSLFNGLMTNIALALGSPRLGFAAPEAPGTEIWPALEDRVFHVLRLDLPSGKSESWRRATRELLRNKPELALDAALIKTFEKTYRPDSHQQAAVNELLGGGSYPQLMRLLLSGAGRLLFGRADGAHLIFSSALIDGRLHVASNSGLYVQEEDGRFTKMLAIQTRKIVQINGTWYAATEHGVFERIHGEWLPYPAVVQAPSFEDATRGSVLAKIEGVLDLASIDGVFYAATEQGLYRKEKYQWKRVIQEQHFWAGRIVRSGKTTYVATGMGLFAFDGKAWTNIRPLAVRDIAIVDGKVFLAAEENVWSMVPGRNGKPSLTEEIDAGGNSFAMIDGKFYAATSRGVYERKAGSWRLVLDLPGAYGISGGGDDFYVSTIDGLVHWRPSETTGRLPTDWQDRLLADIGVDPSQKHASAPETPSPAPNPFQNKDGRSLLSELRR